MSEDIRIIHEEWNNPHGDIKMIMPDSSVTSFSREAKFYALDTICKFLKSLLRNNRIDLGFDMLKHYHEITAKIAKMYYETTNQNFK